MNQTLKMFLIVVISLLAGAGAFYAWSQMTALQQENEQLNQQLAASPTPTGAVSDKKIAPTAEPTPAVAEGKISGTLGYPSEGIPPMSIYAYKQGDFSTYYTVNTAQNQQSFNIGGVAPGTYVVVAYVQSAPQSAGGWTKAVPCGLSVECTDHSLIPVVVGSGQAVTGVEVKDWYVPEGTFPAKP